MNTYLINLASKLPHIRQVLDITQDEISKIMGISRPTLVKVEQHPDKFTHSMALCLFVAVTAQLEKDKILINQFKGENYDTESKFEDLILKSQRLTTFSTANLTGTMAALAVLPTPFKKKGLILLAGGVLAGIKGAQYLMNNKKKKDNLDAESKETEEITNNEDTEKYAHEYIKYLEQQLVEKESLCLLAFQISEWNSLKLIENIQNSSI